VADVAARASFCERDRFRIDLALTEAVTNVVENAFPGGGTHEIRVVGSLGALEASFEVTDAGIPFNPVEAGAPALPATLGEARPGGHGIRLIRNYADRIGYERTGAQNRLTLAFLMDRSKVGTA
jgi:anti-sigma regulatory factor (Ser/Thr protein kinase)